MSDGDHRHLDRRRDGVVHQGGRLELAGLVVGDLLEHAAADGLGRGAVQVRLDQGRVDHRAGVVHDDVAQDAHHAGLGVDLDHAPDGRARPGRVGVEAALGRGLVVDVRGPEVAGRLQPRLDLVGVGAVGEGVDLPGHIGDGHEALGRPAQRDPAVRDLQVLRVGLQHVARHREELVAQVGRGQLGGRAADDDAARGVVAEPPRAQRGVALDDGDPVQVDADGGRHDLGQAGLVAAAR